MKISHAPPYNVALRACARCGGGFAPHFRSARRQTHCPSCRRVMDAADRAAWRRRVRAGWATQET